MTAVSPRAPAAHFAFDNTYARDLEGFYIPWKAASVARPVCVQFNRALAEELGLDAEALASDLIAELAIQAVGRDALREGIGIDAPAGPVAPLIKHDRVDARIEAAAAQ